VLRVAVDSPAAAACGPHAAREVRDVADAERNPSCADPVLELSPGTLSPQRAAKPSQHLPRESPLYPIHVLVERLARHVDLEDRAESGLAHANRNGRARGPTLP
jgi:hypothetical protein